MGERFFHWTDPARALLGTMPDTTLARRLGTSKGIVGRERRRLGIACVPYGVAWDDVPDLGDVTDRTIARRLGVPETNVAAARARRGFTRGRTIRGVMAWDNVPELGVLPDSVVAWMHNADVGAVGGARRRRSKGAAAFMVTTIPLTDALLGALRRLHPHVPPHVAAFLVLAKATGAHDIDR